MIMAIKSQQQSSGSSRRSSGSGGSSSSSCTSTSRRRSSSSRNRSTGKGMTQGGAAMNGWEWLNQVLGLPGTCHSITLYKHPSASFNLERDLNWPKSQQQERSLCEEVSQNSCAFTSYKLSFFKKASHEMSFWEIAKAPNSVFFHAACLRAARKVSSANGRVADVDFMPGSISNRFSIGRKNLQILSWNLELPFFQKVSQSWCVWRFWICAAGVFFAWWAQWICYTFVNLHKFIHGCIFDSRYNNCGRDGDLWGMVMSSLSYCGVHWNRFFLVMLVCVGATASCIARLFVFWQAQYFWVVFCLLIWIERWQS